MSGACTIVCPDRLGRRDDSVGARASILVDAEQECEAASGYVCWTGVVTGMAGICNKLGLSGARACTSRRGLGLGDGDGADNTSHWDRACIEERKTRRVDLRCETYIRVHVLIHVLATRNRRGRGKCLDDDLDGRPRVLREDACALKDALECDCGVFF